MATVVDRTARRTAKVRRRIRRAAGTRLRLSVFRSSKHIYAQVIDDLKGATLASASSLEKEMRTSLKTGADVAAAKAVGKRAVSHSMTPKRAQLNHLSALIQDLEVRPVIELAGLPTESRTARLAVSHK